jgi:hypothetical protein
LNHQRPFRLGWIQKLQTVSAAQSAEGQLSSLKKRYLTRTAVLSEPQLVHANGRGAKAGFPVTSPGSGTAPSNF